MKKTAVYNIGDEMNFDEAAYKRAIRQLTELCPLVNDFARIYEQMTLKKITDDVFTQAMVSGTDSIIVACLKNNPEADKINQLPSTLQEIAKSQYAVLAKTLTATRQAVIERRSQMMQLVKYEDMEWSDIFIKNGSATIKKDQIKERYILRITNEGQIRFLEAMQATKECWDKAVGIFTDYGYDMRVHTAYGWDRFFVEDENDGTLIINPFAIDWIQS